jgi:hypothetical protein
MKNSIKALLNNALFRNIVYKIPIYYDKKKLAQFDTFLNSIKSSDPQDALAVLTLFEQKTSVDLYNDKIRPFKLLQFIHVTLVNPPSVWEIYNKKLFFHDADGKIKIKYQFGTHFNPATLCQYTLSLYDTFYKSKEAGIKAQFLKQVTFLLKEAEETETELRFPYRYDFFDMVKGPWVSGLAQAQGIAVLLRAYLLTSDALYLQLANKSYAAINSQNKLVIEVNGYKWVEEYPTENPSCAINGFTTVIICLLELQRFFPDDAKLSKDIEEYLKTFKDNVGSYDKGKGQIRYSLMNNKIVNNNYLGFQCLQMIHLYYYTKDEVFYHLHLKWQSYFDHGEFISSYLPINQLNRKLKDLSNGL